MHSLPSLMRKRDKPLGRSSWLVVVGGLVSVLSAALTGNVVRAEDFRVSVQISEQFADGKVEVIDRRVYVFYKSKAYDVALLKPNDVAVVDPTGNSVRLLSRVKNVQHTIETIDLVQEMGRVRAFAKKHDLENQLGIGAAVIKKSGDYRVGFPNFDYSAKTVTPPRKDIPQRFAEFTEWLARVNLYRGMGTPPFGRMALSGEIANDELVPESITLNLTSPSAARTFVTEYHFSTELTPADQRRVDEVSGMMALYRNVPAAEFPY